MARATGFCVAFSRTALVAQYDSGTASTKASSRPMVAIASVSSVACHR